jgi:hypothetical protein
MKSLPTTRSSLGETPAGPRGAGPERTASLSSSAVGAHALVSLLILSAFLTLFVFRSVDDNSLTSWQWVFVGGDVARILAILIAGLALAYVTAKVSLPERYPKTSLFLLSFLVGSLFWREPEMIVDSARYFTQAKHLELYGIGYFLVQWGREIPAWTDLPLIPFLYGVVFAVWGEARVAIQVFTTLLFSGTVVLTHLIGETLWDETVGFYGGALLLGMPYLLTQVPLMLVDVPTMFFLALAMFTAIKALERGEARWVIVASGAMTLVLLSKYSTWPWLTVAPIAVAVYAGKEPRQVLLRATALLSASTLLVGVMLFLRYEITSEQLGLLQSFQLPALKGWRESFASTFFFQIHPFITILAAYSLVVAVKKRDRRYAIIAWLWLLAVAWRIERIRYLLPLFPMLALMASYGVREIKSLEIRRFTASCIVMSSLAVATFGHLPFLMKISAVNLKNAGRYLDLLDGDTVEVVPLSQGRDLVNPAISVPLLDLFTSKRIIVSYPSSSLPPRKEIEMSPVRFTWEYRTPRYYAGGGANGEAAVVIISGYRDDRLPDQIERKVKNYRLAKAFEISDDWFQYQTLVRVYQPAGRAQAGRRS